MEKHLTPAFLAFLSAASINCTSLQQAEHPQQPDCSSIDLLEKVGFSAKLENSEKESICYKIRSGAGRYYEYIGFCEPAEGTFNFYRHFAGLNKGGMEMDYIFDSRSMLAYIPFSRTPSGEMAFPPSTEVPINVIEQKFKDGAELLDYVKTIPRVCKELQEYRKK